jgi:hypothetical protein
LVRLAADGFGLVWRAGRLLGWRAERPSVWRGRLGETSLGLLGVLASAAGVISTFADYR